MDAGKAVAELAANISYLGIGRVLGLATAADGAPDTVRIKFKSVQDAVGWVDDYAKLDQAVFETYPITLADSVVVRFPVSAYDHTEEQADE